MKNEVSKPTSATGARVAKRMSIVTLWVKSQKILATTLPTRTSKLTTIQAVPMGEKFRELKDIFRLLETYHEAVESLGLATTFANKEKWEMLKSDNRAERAIHWGAAAAPWRILSGRIAGIPYHLMAEPKNRKRGGENSAGPQQTSLRKGH